MPEGKIYEFMGCQLHLEYYGLRLLCDNHSGDAWQTAQALGATIECVVSRIGDTWYRRVSENVRKVAEYTTPKRLLGMQQDAYQLFLNKFGQYGELVSKWPLYVFMSYNIEIEDWIGAGMRPADARHIGSWVDRGYLDPREVVTWMTDLEAVFPDLPDAGTRIASFGACAPLVQWFQPLVDAGMPPKEALLGLRQNGVDGRMLRNLDGSDQSYRFMRAAVQTISDWVGRSS